MLEKYSGAFITSEKYLGPPGTPGVFQKSYKNIYNLDRHSGFSGNSGVFENSISIRIILNVSMSLFQSFWLTSILFFFLSAYLFTIHFFILLIYFCCLFCHSACLSFNLSVCQSLQSLQTFMTVLIILYQFPEIVNNP